MAAEAGTWIEGLKAEGLGFGSIDDFMDVDAHAHAELLELVDEGDVDAPIDVLEQLGHLGDRGSADRDYAAKDCAVVGGSKFGGSCATASDNLGNVVACNCLFSGIFAFRRKGDMNAGLVGIARYFETVAISFLDERHNYFFGGAGVRGALENDELAVVKMRGYGLYCAGDVAEVGLVVLIEGRRDADDDGVHLRDVGIVRGGAETGFLCVLDIGWRDANDVGTAGVKSVDLAGFNVETGDAEAFVAE